MSKHEPVIMFVRPKAITAADKKMLSGAGVLVVEIENPQDAKLIRANAELTGTEMLMAAAKVISESSSGYIRDAFGKAICEALLQKSKPD